MKILEKAVCENYNPDSRFYGKAYDAIYLFGIRIFIYNVHHVPHKKLSIPMRFGMLLEVINGSM